MSLSVPAAKKQKVSDGSVEENGSDDTGDNESSSKEEDTENKSDDDDRTKDVLRPGTESELAKVPNIIYSMSMVEPNYRNGGTKAMFELFHTEYDALKSKWEWVTAWADGQDDADDSSSPQCRFSAWTHEGTYGDDYIYCTIQKIDMSSVKDNGSFYLQSLNC